MRAVSYLSPGFPPALFELLGDRIGAEVSFETETSGPPAGEDPFRSGAFDLGWVCSTSYVELGMGDDPSIRLVGVAWVPRDPASSGRPVYFGDLCVAPGSSATSLADLAGSRIACNDAVSLSGNHALRIALADLGHDAAEFADLVFTGGHRHSLDALAAGRVDACVVDSVVRTGRARHDRRIAELRVVERLGPWPVQPLVARHDLEPAVVAEVRAALLATNDDPVVAAALHEAALTRHVAVDERLYHPVREALTRSGLSLS